MLPLDIMDLFKPHGDIYYSHVTAKVGRLSGFNLFLHAPFLTTFPPLPTNHNQITITKPTPTDTRANRLSHGKRR